MNPGQIALLGLIGTLVVAVGGILAALIQRSHNELGMIHVIVNSQQDKLKEDLAARTKEALELRTQLATSLAALQVATNEVQRLRAGLVEGAGP